METRDTAPSFLAGCQHKISALQGDLGVFQPLHTALWTPLGCMRRTACCQPLSDVRFWGFPCRKTATGVTARWQTQPCAQELQCISTGCVHLATKQGNHTTWALQNPTAQCCGKEGPGSGTQHATGHQQHVPSHGLCPHLQHGPALLCGSQLQRAPQQGPAHSTALSCCLSPSKVQRRHSNYTWLSPGQGAPPSPTTEVPPGHGDRGHAVSPRFSVLALSVAEVLGDQTICISRFAGCKPHYFWTRVLSALACSIYIGPQAK